MYYSRYLFFFKTVLFKPIAFNGCVGIVFIHHVWMGGRVGGRAAEKSCSGMWLRRCKKLKLCSGIGWGRVVGLQHHGVTLI